MRVVLGRSPRVYAGARHLVELSRFALRRPHEPDFRAFALFPERTGLFLDIGANSGASALSFRIFNRRSPILSLEPNPAHRKSLQRVGRVVRRFEFRLVAAGEEPGVVRLWIPRFRGMPLTGEASLAREAAERPHWVGAHAGCSRDQRDDRVRVESISVPMVRVDDLDLRPDFVKIDVEGAELQVLRGFERTLKRSQPVLLIEIGHKLDVVEHLRALGYQPRRYRPETHSLVEYTGGDVQNLIFVPPSEAGRAPPA